VSSGCLNCPACSRKIFLFKPRLANQGASEWFAGVRDQNAPEILTIGSDPLLDDLRGDPAFQALVRKISTPKTE
jgi:hypothetical protein